MLRFALGRLARGIPTLALVAIAVFGLVRLLPGDPALLMLGDMADPENLASMRHSMGLDQPLPVQFMIWLGRVLQGDLGNSIATGQAVLPLILDRFAVTATIVLTAVAFAVLVAVPAGMFAAWRRDSLADLMLVGGATLLLSIPSFWLGLLFLLLFGLKLGWLPVVGYVPISQDVGAGLSYILLPVVTLALIEAGALIRMVRSSTLEVLHLDYITHARAKGLSEWSVMLRHAGINAFAPAWTMIGLILGNLLGGIAVIETVFTLPGLGRLIVDSIFARDYPVVQGCLLFFAVVYVLVNLVIDLCYPIFDSQGQAMTTEAQSRGGLKVNAALGGGLIAVVLTGALIGMVWTPVDPLGIDFTARLQPPGEQHWLGTDEFGRDVLSRILAGAASSSLISLLTVTLAVIAGTFLGVVAGYWRGTADAVLMTLNDALLAFPGLLLALGLLTALGPGKYGVVLALALAYMPSVLRVVRGAVLSLREREFVEASRAMGNGEIFTVLRHVLPNCLAPLIVLATSMFGWVLLSESALSFLGLGVPPPAPTWGNMLASSRGYIAQAPWLGIFPGLCISVSLLGINLLGDALRDRLDPRMRQ